MWQAKTNILNSNYNSVEEFGKLFRAKTRHCQKHPRNPIRRILGLLDL
jgi:hypothetical protein